MFTSDFDYQLPREYIAQKPQEPRDHSRLMVVDKGKKSVVHDSFFNLLQYLRPDDLLVWNNSRVFKARLFGILEGGKGEELWHGQQVEIFLIKPQENEGVWQVLGKPGRRLAPGMRVRFAPDFFCDIMVKSRTGEILVQFSGLTAEQVRQKANQYGHVPVPPYVKDEPHQLDIYQTVYARAEGSVAAPTAGFHFTPDLIEKIKKRGVQLAEITLHVGLGTFLPVKAERVDDHVMHSEYVELTAVNAELINQAKKDGRRIIAVGTTTVRTLEGLAQQAGFHDQRLEPYQGEINIFIRPGFSFQIIDGLITNFHLPRSTLLMLVAAFAGDTKFVLDCYEEAKAKNYR